MISLVPPGNEPRRNAGSRLRLAVFAVLLQACGSDFDGDACPTCPSVARISVTVDVVSLEEGQSTTAVARAFDASDREVTGQAVAWTSSDSAVAGVADGRITALRPGMVRISARMGTVTGSVDVTVTLASVARVEMNVDSLTLFVGYGRELTAITRSATGAALDGRPVSWQSTDPAVLSVDPSSAGITRVRALQAGTSRIIANSGARADTALVRVVVPVASRVRVTPRYLAVNAGDSALVSVEAVAASGDTVYTPAITWTSDSSAVAGGAGPRVRGLAPGAARLAATVDGISDTVTVAVLGPRSLLSTAWARGQMEASVRAGDTVSIPVVVDLGRRGTTGDLGAAQMSLAFPTTLLEYVDADAPAGVTVLVHQAQPGTLRIAYVASDPRTDARVTLVVLRFRVAAAAAAGQRGRLRLTHLIEPLGTTFQPLGMPVVPQGTIQIVP
jgi:hypothetical protein